MVRVASVYAAEIARKIRESPKPQQYDEERNALILAVVPNANEIASRYGNGMKEDMQQQAYLKLLLCVGMYRGEGEFANFAKKCAKRAIIDMHRRERRRRDKELRFSELSHDWEEIFEKNSSGSSDGAECADEIAALTCSLSDDERTLLKERYFNGLTQQEVGKMMGLKPTTVCMREKRILGKLRNKARARELCGSLGCSILKSSRNK